MFASADLTKDPASVQSSAQNITARILELSGGVEPIQIRCIGHSLGGGTPDTNSLLLTRPRSEFSGTVKIYVLWPRCFEQKSEISVIWGVVSEAGPVSSGILHTWLR